MYVHPISWWLRMRKSWSATSETGPAMAGPAGVGAMAYIIMEIAFNLYDVHFLFCAKILAMVEV